jgi:FAD/FMN-containing dehydrogenase
VTAEMGTLVDVEGRVVHRGEREYEEVRRSAVWNARTPERFPDVIVTAASDQDVVQAVRSARSRGMKVAVRAGGHSICGSPLRDGGMLIDLSQLRELSIDPASRTAVVQPAVTGRELARALAEHDLAFPVGHCGSVPLSGYLLSGGFGWNMGAWGPACFGLRRVELVTADGRLLSADEERNRDLLWAARGAGPGFFGVATRFHLALQPLPKVMRASMYLYPLAAVEELSRWAADTLPTLPPHVERLLLLTSAPPGMAAGPAGKVVGVMAIAFADTEDDAMRSLSALETCPVLGRALVRRVGAPTSFEELFDTIGTLLPERHRYLEDSLWSDRALPALLPRLAERLVGAPSSKSLVFAVMPPPRPEGIPLPDAAFSMVGRCFLLCYAIWDDESADADNERWFRSLVDSVLPLSIGHYVAEADLAASPSRSVRSFAPAQWRRLRALRAEHDPQRVFHDYLGLS